jgi:hypothetical protein
MAIGVYMPSITDAIAEAGWLSDTVEGNIFIIERRVKTNTEGDGTRVIWVGQGGDDPDGSSLDIWTYTKADGWVAESVLSDTTRAAVEAQVIHVSLPQVAAIISDADYATVIALLTA